MNYFQQFQSVKVIDDSLERFGQVGTYVGMDGEDCKLKFDGVGMGADPVYETFEPSSLQGL